MCAYAGARAHGVGASAVLGNFPLSGAGGNRQEADEPKGFDDRVHGLSFRSFNAVEYGCGAVVSLIRAGDATGGISEAVGRPASG